MKEKILRLLNLKPEEFSLAFALWLLLALNTMVLELSDVVATAGFVSNVGVKQVPWLWLVTTTITVFAAGGYAMLVDRFPRLRFISWMLISLAIFYLLLQLLFTLGAPDWLTFPALYILADQQWALMPLAFWALANDVYAVAEAKRLYPLIGSGAVVGSLAGNSLAAAMGMVMAQGMVSRSVLFSLAAGLLILGLLILRLSFRKRTVRARQSRQEDTNLRETLTIGLDYFTNVPLLKAVAVVMLLTGVGLALIEYHFLFSIEQGFSGDLQFQTFLGAYKTVQTIGLLLFQWLITSRVLQRIPLKNAFSVLPAALTAAGGLALAVPGLLGAALARFVGRTVFTAWDEPTRKSLQGLIPDERRGRVSAFMDSYFYAAATILSSILLLVLSGVTALGWLGEGQSRLIALGVAAAAALGSIFAAWHLRSVYDQSMLNWRLARSKRKSVLDGIDF